jgi:hypothetical protein
MLFRRVDGELSGELNRELDAHLSACAACAREYRLLLIPKQIGRIIPALEPSPYFYQKLRARLEEEAQSVTIWQILLGLSRQVVPALAMITLALLAVFAYVQLRGPSPDIYQAYDRIFTTDRPQRMVIADHEEITDESVLRSIAEEGSDAVEPAPIK